MRSPAECHGLLQRHALSPAAGRVSAGCTAVDVVLGDIWDLCCLAPHIPLCTCFMVACTVREHMTSRKAGNPTVACATASVPKLVLEWKIKSKGRFYC